MAPSKDIDHSGYYLATPAFALMLLLFIAPTLGVLVISMTDWQFGSKSISFVGARNFEIMMADPSFRQAAANTTLYVLLVVPGTVLSGLVVALLIESGKRFRAFYRAVHFVPFMATLAAMAVVWESLLHPTIGLVNQLLVMVGLPTANWLRDERVVIPALAAIGIWQNLGFAMLLFLSGLKRIPQELYDAADVDGADQWLDRLRTVTLPMLGPVALFVTVVVALKAFETFDTVQILTQGGPSGSSTLLLYMLYRESFEYLHTGYGAAITVVFLMLVIALTVLQVRTFDKKVHYS